MTEIEKFAKSLQDFIHNPQLKVNHRIGTCMYSFYVITSANPKKFGDNREVMTVELDLERTCVKSGFFKGTEIKFKKETEEFLLKKIKDSILAY